MRAISASVFSTFALLLSACSSPEKQTRSPAIGVAYAGPSTLNVHEDIDSKSATVAVAHHGDKLDIIAQRRHSWYKVRTARGMEGWTSNRELLDSGQMNRLRALAAETAGMPSQGTASTFSMLNVHIEPTRLSTSFVQVVENEKFDVIAHKVAPRVAPPPRELVPPKPKIAKKTGKNAKKPKDAVPPPPAPDAPPPPPDWLELSRGRDPEPVPTQPFTPVPTDDWTLIRTRAGQSGWVLTSAVYLQIPDEVAQYAEGHRITSYFSLGKIADAGEQKDIWLWTTSDGLGEDHDFDGYRVFVWSLRHHRYETAYIQRRERGFFPILARQGEFSVCLERPDGSRTRKQYAMVGNAVKGAGEKPCEKITETEEGAQNLPSTEAPSGQSEKGLAERAKDRLKSIFKRP
jgi:Bacterial SH3 domain